MTNKATEIPKSHWVAFFIFYYLLTTPNRFFTTLLQLLEKSTFCAWLQLVAGNCTSLQVIADKKVRLLRLGSLQSTTCIKDRRFEGAIQKKSNSSRL